VRGGERIVDSGLSVRGDSFHLSASGAHRRYRGFGSEPGCMSKSAVNPKGLPEPKNSHKNHEEQGQDHGGFRDLGTARAPRQITPCDPFGILHLHLNLNLKVYLNL